jgi:hypothetical protein
VDAMKHGTVSPDPRRTARCSARIQSLNLSVFLVLEKVLQSGEAWRT